MLARFSQFVRSASAHIARIWPKSKAGSLLSFFGLAIVALGVLGIASPASAGFLTDVFNGILHAFSWIMFILARLFIGLTIFFLKFFIEVAKYNNFIDTSTVKVGWFLVRDVANMFFVVILLVISFGTILGIEQYEWKKTLVKLILAAVFINFSNMIAQLIIDAAHVFTITFVNAISATAGGNLIRMFNIDTVYQITGAEKFGEGADLKLETFAASVTVFMLAFIMMVTIGAYALVMVARMVVLWVLIILSPLAYIFQVLPQTQKYAQEWWSTFINHVIVAPVMVFFLWLSFATLNDKSHGIQVDKKATSEATQVIDDGVGTGVKKLSISEASSWENMANYIIAIAFLLVGLRKVRELGVEAGGLTSSVTGFAKNVGTIATGYALGRAIVGKGVDMGKDQAKKQFMNFPVVGGRSWARAGKVVNEARASVPLLKMIPILGRYNEEYQDKLDDRLEKTHKMRRESRDKDMSKTGDPMIEKQIQKLGNLAPKLVHWGVKKMGGQGTIDKLGMGQWEHGLFGIQAWTKRRNAAEQELKAGVDMRSPENRALREARNREELLQRGRRFLVDEENAVFDKWAKKNDISIDDVDVAVRLGVSKEDIAQEFEESLGQNQLWKGIQGDKGLSRVAKARAKKKFKKDFMRQKVMDHNDGEVYQQFRGDDDAKKALDKRFKKLNLSRTGATTRERETRNAAQYLVSHERVETAREAIKLEEAMGSEAVINSRMEEKDNLIQERAEAEQLSQAAADRIKSLKNVHLEQVLEDTLDGLQAAIIKGNAGEFLKQNKFARALLLKGEAANDEEIVNMIRSMLQSDLESEFIGDRDAGGGLPSTAMADTSKRAEPAFARLGEAAIGGVISSNFLKIVSKSRRGEKISRRHRKESYTRLFAANRAANIDDGISSEASLMNAIDLYRSLEGDDEKLEQAFDEDQLAAFRDPEMMADYDKYYETIKKYGLADQYYDSKSGTYSWIDKADHAPSGKLQLYMVTGGDEDYIDTSENIGNYMKSQKDDHNRSLSFDEAARELLTKEAYESYYAKSVKYQDLLSDAETQFKEQAIASGHFQLGMHFANFGDFRELVRPLMPWEQKAAMGGSLAKRKNYKIQPQSYGRYANSLAYMLDVDERIASNLEPAQATTTVGYANKVDDRVRRVAHLGGHRDTAAIVREDGYGMMGGSLKHIQDLGFGTDQEAIKRGLFDKMLMVMAPQAASASQNIVFGAHGEFKNIGRLDAEAGFMLADVHGAAEVNADLSARSVSEFAAKTKKFIEENAAEVIQSWEREMAKLDDDNPLKGQIQNKLNTYRQRLTEVDENTGTTLMDRLQKNSEASRKKEDAYLEKYGRTRDSFGAASDGEDGAATPSMPITQDVRDIVQATNQNGFGRTDVSNGIAAQIAGHLQLQLHEIDLPADAAAGIGEKLQEFAQSLVSELESELTFADGDKNIPVQDQVDIFQVIQERLKAFEESVVADMGDDDAVKSFVERLQAAREDAAVAMNHVAQSSEDGGGTASPEPEDQVLKDILNVLQETRQADQVQFNATTLGNELAEKIKQGLDNSLNNLKIPEESLEGITEVLSKFVDDFKKKVTNEMKLGDSNAVPLEHQKDSLDIMHRALKNLVEELKKSDSGDDVEKLAAAIRAMGVDTKRAMNSVDRRMQQQVAQQKKKAPKKKASPKKSKGPTQEELDQLTREEE